MGSDDESSHGGRHTPNHAPTVASSVLHHDIAGRQRQLHAIVELEYHVAGENDPEIRRVTYSPESDVVAPEPLPGMHVEDGDEPGMHRTVPYPAAAKVKAQPSPIKANDPRIFAESYFYFLPSMIAPHSRPFQQVRRGAEAAKNSWPVLDDRGQPLVLWKLLPAVELWTARTT